ncbi:hypothetical protein HK096_005436 [Nowakowskiella sp. JEL0078]|nr:hypothetical protein HK096_005436 [Nowakowskiella sp. JEL0078]
MFQKKTSSKPIGKPSITCEIRSSPEFRIDNESTSIVTLDEPLKSTTCKTHDTYQAKYSFQARTTDEISFKRHDMIIVNRIFDDGL